MKIFVCMLLVGGVISVVHPAHADAVTDEREAAQVFRAMHGDLERCFARANGNAGADASAFITIDVLVDGGGRVRDVKTTGGAKAGAWAMRCVERRVARAVFPVPRGGGTSRVSVAFSWSFEPGSGSPASRPP